jgi:hypothetical protein
VRRKTYDNNAEQLPTQIVEHEWVTDEWFETQRWLFDRDAEGNPTEITNQELNEEQNWINQERVLNSYFDGLLQEQIEEVWSVDEWLDTSRTTYSYNEIDLLTEEVYQEWDGADWIDLSRESYSYNDQDLLSTHLREVIFEMWSPTTYWTYSYDLDNRLVEMLKQTYNTELDVWDNQERTTYDYGPVTDVHLVEDPALPDRISLAQNYPNPFNPSTHIRFTIVESGRVNLTVFDLLGRRVETVFDEYLAAGTHVATFDASGLPSGVYLYRLSVGEYELSRKMLLLR